MGKLKLAASSCALLLGLALTASAEETEYYTWVDENGVVNYSERNPQGYNARFISNESRFGYHQATLSQPNTSAPAEAVTQEKEKAPSADAGEPVNFEQQIAAEKAKIAAQLAPEKEANCAIGKRNLAQLEAYARIKIKDADGKQRVLNDEEKAERVAQAKQTIRDNCL